MAIVAKVTMYICGPNMDIEYDSMEEEVLYKLERGGIDTVALAIDCEEKGFEWDDDVVINHSDCSIGETEKFFDALPGKVLKYGDIIDGQLGEE